ncbi:CoA transferase [Lampropedia puyangensis]|uniref:CoA transferase n=1 Tax=Lampropedia puyangensis TaxID=1330072 RepID=A0A4S8EP88_9BURK|nr:CaiB/BaiF CoA-transferase family protein [Lampropedia puyangensis]THT96452.1 CoA transferase [Lampropedia puyangensis]
MTQAGAAMPLAGIRVLDLSRVLAGPLCAQTLGDLGAEVIKVEHPGRGDDTRDWGLRVNSTQTAYFNSVNRNKRSITVDLQHPEGQQLVRELAAQCDVVVQNFKFGGAQKLGVGYEDIKALKDDIIYVSVSGYAAQGQEAARPGYDLVVQAEAGLMAMNGEATQPPLKFGVAVVDLFTGMHAAQAVLAALFDRERSGCGRHVQLALFDCGLMLTAYYGLEALQMGEDPPRYGNSHPSIVPYGVFEAADGPLVITVGNNAQFQRFAREVIERPDMAQDPRFATNVLRGQYRNVLIAQIEEALRTFTRAQLLPRLASAGIPCGEVLGLLQALQSPRAQATGMVQAVPAQEGATSHVLAAPFVLDGQRTAVRQAPPFLGEGTREVLQTLLHLDDARLAQLQANGVL